MTLAEVGMSVADTRKHSLMSVMDRINDKYDHDTLRPAAQGSVDAFWRMQRTLHDAVGVGRVGLGEIGTEQIKRIVLLNFLLDKTQQHIYKYSEFLHAPVSPHSFQAGLRLVLSVSR